MKQKIIVHPQTIEVETDRLVFERQLARRFESRVRPTEADKEAQRLFDRQEADNIKRVAFAKEFAIQWRWRLKELIK